MGKPKRGKKGRQDEDDWEDGVAAEVQGLSLEGKAEGETNGQLDEPAKPKTKKKDKKKKQEEQASDEDDNDDSEAPTKATSKGKAKGMSAFQMLAIDSDDQSAGSSDEEAAAPKPVSKKDKKKKTSSFDGDEDDLAVMEDTHSPEPAQSKAKAKKKGKKADKPAEEDIDALLAEIESSAPTMKGKKKKKGKAQAEDDMETEEKAINPEEAGSSAAGLEAMDVSEMTQDQIAAWLDDGQYDEDDGRKKKKKGKAKKQKVTTKEAEPGDNDDLDEEAQEAQDEGGDEEEGEDGPMKTAAQKKKDKKERQKQQKLADKAKQQQKKKSGKAAETEGVDEGAGAGAEVPPAKHATTEHTTTDATTEHATADAATAQPTDITEEKDEDDDAEGDKKKKKKDKKKKGKKIEEDEEEKKKKPSKMAKAILELQKKQKEEEERMEREEDEKELLIEAKRKEKEEQERKEKEKKEREKQKRKEKIERLKAEGKYETPKQKADRIRAEQMLEALKAQGVSVPQPGESDGPKKRVVYEKKKKKRTDQDQQQTDVTPTDTPTETPTEEKDAEIKMVVTVEAPVEKEQEKEKEEIVESWEDVKDDWDAESEAEEEKDSKEPSPEKDEEHGGSDEESDEDSEEEEEEEESSSEESSDEEDDRTPVEKARDRIQNRKEVAETKRTTDNLRAPVVCVLGHVDTGKTKILDKLRRTHVQDDEAGGITQQIGATNVPADAIREQTKMCKEFAKQELKVPGLLIIDTPGHESFSNLRTRGSSLCDIAILVIDIMHGLEPQTIESINLLKKRKTPFIVALNKIDRLFQWQSNPHNDVGNTLKKQKTNTKQEFDERLSVTIVQLAEQGLNACLFNENKNPREYISLVPTSAHSGDGMGNLIALICELSQTMLAKRVAFSEHLQATVMEVKAIQGLGTTIDVILVNGAINEGDTIIIAGQEGPIVTQVRALLMPQPMKELRVKNAYSKYKEVLAAQGCKIIAKDLEKALAGLPLYTAGRQDEVEYYKEEISEALEDILGSIKLQERGVFVQASTLGSLEALLEFLRTSKIPYAGINIGPVHRKDIMKASIMLEHDTQWAVILAFDVKVEREAQEMADSLGVLIFTAEIIYHLFDKFMAHRDKLKKQKQDEFKNVAVFPCKLRIMPQYIFNSRDPIVCGVIVEAGFIKNGTPICVPTKEFLDVGRITSLEVNHKQVDKAVKGQEVCIKIESLPGDTPKLYGRHFDHTDMLVSKINRQSIDAVKNYFREEMGKNDWQLIMELKKTFEII